MAPPRDDAPPSPDDRLAQDAAAFVQGRGLTPLALAKIKGEVAAWGTRLLDLAHGAAVYDVGGQNVCLADCLTHSADPDDMRQLIYNPDGRLTYKGAVLLQGKARKG